MIAIFGCNTFSFPEIYIPHFPFLHSLSRSSDHPSHINTNLHLLLVSCQLEQDPRELAILPSQVAIIRYISGNLVANIPIFKAIFSSRQLAVYGPCIGSRRIFHSVSKLAQYVVPTLPNPTNQPISHGYSLYEAIYGRTDISPVNSSWLADWLSFILGPRVGRQCVRSVPFRRIWL